MTLHKQIRKNIGVSSDAASTIVRCNSLNKDRRTIHKEKNLLDNVIQELLECNHDLQCISERMNQMGSVELTLDEVGQVLGITRERVRQIEFAALRKLKSPYTLRKLRAYIMM